MAKPFVVTGFPYAFPYYWKVFEHLKNKEDFVFILPDPWIIKDGKAVFKLDKKKEFPIYGLRALSYGNSSLLGGIWKGWMPGIGLMLPYLKFKYGARVLYSCSEPNLLTTLYNGILARILGYKHILFTWQNVPPGERMSGLKLRLSNALVRLNLALADGIICGNKKAESVIKNIEISKYRNIKTVVCPISGVDTGRFKPLDKAQGKPGFIKENYILFYGALDKRKGVDVLIQAFKILNTKYEIRNTKLLIIGTGPEKEKLVNLVKELGISDSVIFRDWMKNEELPAVLSKAAVFVYPSVPSGGWEEQFGYAMAEASACGVPVVATRTGSIEEVVVNEKSGFLVESNRSDQLADALRVLLKDEGLRKRMGEFGRKYIEENFSHQTVAGKIENFLNSFVN